MNIKETKEYIKNSVHLYLKKDEYGEYVVPVVRQRPIFLLGAPGIGKTAIMEQVAEELGIALVAYSMTHHTRQSALGLPYIEKKQYGDKTYSVSEYTMSEIIASIYDTMEKSGVREGILFLDEINCVSETLAPSMLQFLQYKVFGRHSVPEGWVIVTAGNPPEYNKSVREFDVVTMDRLKLLEVEADYESWREYARERQIHGAILNYLDLKKDQFYVMEMTTKGRSYVTARGWEDLSRMLQLYEEDEIPVEESLIGQYIHNDKITREFSAYYDLYNKYKKDYRIEEILEGAPSAQALIRAKEAQLDERLSLLGMLLDKITGEMDDCMERAKIASELRTPLKAVSDAATEKSAEEVLELLKKLAETAQKRLESLLGAGALSDKERKSHRGRIHFLQEALRDAGEAYMDAKSGAELFETVKTRYAQLVKVLQKDTEKTKARLSNLFVFVEEAFTEGNEMLILVTELTVQSASAGFIATFGSEEYNRHNKELMVSDRNRELLDEIGRLEL